MKKNYTSSKAISPAFVHLTIVFFVQEVLLYHHLLHPLRPHWKSGAGSLTHSWFKCNEMYVMSLARSHQLPLTPGPLKALPLTGRLLWLLL